MLKEDEDLKIKTRDIVLSVLIILLIPLVVAFLIWFPYKIIPAGDENGWLGFFGGYFGSLLSVVAAYKIANTEMKRLKAQFETEQRIQRENWIIEQYSSIYRAQVELQIFKHNAVQIKTHFENGIDDVNAIKKLLSKLDVDLLYLFNYIKIPELSKKLISVIKYKDALLPELKDFISLKEQLDLATRETKRNYNVILNISKDPTQKIADAIRKMQDPNYKTIEEKQDEVLKQKQNLLNVNDQFQNKCRDYVPVIEELINLCDNYLASSNKIMESISTIANKYPGMA